MSSFLLRVFTAVVLIVLPTSSTVAIGFSAGEILGFDDFDGSFHRIDPVTGATEQVFSLIDYNGANRTFLGFIDVLGPSRLLLAGEGPGFRPGLDVLEYYELNTATNGLKRLSRFQEATDAAQFPFPPRLLTDPLGVGVRTFVELGGTYLLQNSRTDEELLRFDPREASIEFVREFGGGGDPEIVAVLESGRLVGRRFTNATFEVSGNDFGVGDRLLSIDADFDPAIIRPLGPNTMAVFDARRRNFLAFNIDTLTATTLASFDVGLPSVEDFVVLEDGDILFASNFAGPALGRIEAGTSMVTVINNAPVEPRFSRLTVVPAVPEPTTLTLAAATVTILALRQRRHLALGQYKRG